MFHIYLAASPCLHSHFHTSITSGKFYLLISSPCQGHKNGHLKAAFSPWFTSSKGSIKAWHLLSASVLLTLARDPEFLSETCRNFGCEEQQNLAGQTTPLKKTMIPEHQIHSTARAILPWEPVGPLSRRTFWIRCRTGLCRNTLILTRSFQSYKVKQYY